MINDTYPKGYPHCAVCSKVLEDCGCDTANVRIYYPEVGETQSVVRVATVLGTTGSTPLQKTESWEEVRNCRGGDICLCTNELGELPNLFVVRKGQMFKLKWPELPSIPGVSLTDFQPRDNSKDPTPYAIYCGQGDIEANEHGCGLVFLTEEQYRIQLGNSDYPWKCPKCLSCAEWDDDSQATRPLEGVKLDVGDATCNEPPERELPGEEP